MAMISFLQVSLKPSKTLSMSEWRTNYSVRVTEKDFLPTDGMATPAEEIKKNTAGRGWDSPEISKTGTWFLHLMCWCWLTGSYSTLSDLVECEGNTMTRVFTITSYTTISRKRWHKELRFSVWINSSLWFLTLSNTDFKVMKNRLLKAAPLKTTGWVLRGICDWF